MILNVNKDFEKEYRTDFWKGFTIKEFITIFIALLVGVGVIYLIHKTLGIPIATCVYIAVPCIAPIVAIGFYEYQGMKIPELIKEVIYTRKTKILTYEATEKAEQNIFSMNYKSLVTSDERLKEQKKLYRKMQKRRKHK